MPAAAAIVAVTAVTALVQNNQAKQARKDGNRIAGEQRADAEAAKKAIADKQAEENSNDARDQAKARQRGLSKGAQGRSSTILTSPLGVTAPAAQAQKTLLGS